MALIGEMKFLEIGGNTYSIPISETIYCTCSTAEGTAAKTATIVSGELSTLATGTLVFVKFTNSNTASNPTLQVGSTTAKSIKRYGTTAPSTSAASSWNAGAVISFIYDGTYWQMTDWINTTYSGMTDAEVSAGTGTSNRLITPARLKTAVQTWAPVTSVNGSTGAITITVPSTAADVGAVATSAVGAASGVAPLNASGKIDETYLPSYVDDVIEGYYYNNKFYKESTHTTEITGEAGKIYVDLSTEKVYRYGGTAYVEISSGTSVTISRNLTSGTKSATINVDGTDYDIYSKSGTVTSIGLTNATNGGLTISGSPVTSSGSITVGHTNILTSAQTTQAVYPIKIDKNGHISEYGSAVSIPSKTSDLTNDSGFITDAGVTSFNGDTGAITYTAPVTSVNGNTGAVTLDVDKWNGVSLNKTSQTSGGADMYVPFLWTTSETTAKLVLAGSGRIGNTIATYNSNGYLISTTPSADDNSTKVATTAFVAGAVSGISVPTASSTTPAMDGTAAVGSETAFARGDHVHPTDTSRAATTTVTTQASIGNDGLITYKNSGNTSLYTVQLPLFDGSSGASSLDFLPLGGGTITGNLTVNGTTTLGSTLGVSGKITGGNGLDITGATTTQGILSVNGTVTSTGLLTASNGISTTTLTTSGNTTIGGTLGVTGATTLSTLTTSGNSTIGGTLGITGAATLSSTLGVTGNTTIGGTLNVNGDVTTNVLNTTSLNGILKVEYTTIANGSSGSITIPNSTSAFLLVSGIRDGSKFISSVRCNSKSGWMLS